ncbi:MAG: DinB family protein, partial [Saprospiraceae bacterium]
MHVSALLKDYVAFNVWANEQYIQWFKDQPDTVLEQPIVSSFPSVRLTLLHIYAAEDVWLHRLKGDVPTIFLANTFEGSNAVLMDSMLSNSANFRDYIQAQMDAFFEEAVAYKDLAGNA